MEKYRCPVCGKLTDQPVCPVCGWAEGQTNAPHQLQPGTVLRGQYVIGRALGQGGYGILEQQHGVSAIGHLRIDAERRLARAAVDNGNEVVSDCYAVLALLVADLPSYQAVDDCHD